jgi:hypothetical protein
LQKLKDILCDFTQFERCTAHVPQVNVRPEKCQHWKGGIGRGREGGKKSIKKWYNTSRCIGVKSKDTSYSKFVEIVICRLIHAFHLNVTAKTLIMYRFTLLKKLSKFSDEFTHVFEIFL